MDKNEGNIMPQNMLKKMLCSLCSDGAVFCHSIREKTGVNRNPIMETNPDIPSSFTGFIQNVPGGRGFKAEPNGPHPYYAPERHPSHVEIIFPVSVPIDFLVNSEWKTLTIPKTHILFRNTRHTERHCGNQPYSLLWLTSLPGSLTLHRTSYSPEAGYSQSACRIAVMPPMAKALWECGSADVPDDLHYFSLLVQCLEFICSQNLAEQNTQDYHYTVIAQIKEFLDENFVRPIALEELSHMAHCSVIHLNRLFAARYHKTIHQYLLDLRMEEARQLLRKGFSPGETAARTGFSDQRYFSRFFRLKNGFSPTEFKQSVGRRGN